MPTLLRGAALPLLLLLPSTALGQLVSQVSRHDLERLHPPPMAECSLVVGCGEAGPAGSFRLALDASYETKPLILGDDGRLGGGGFGTGEQAGSVVAGRTAVHLAGAYAVRDGLELHADLPFVVSQGGDDLSLRAIETPGSWGAGSPVLGIRWTAWSQRHGAPLTAALRLDAVAPLGWGQALAGNTGWVYEPRVEVASWSETGVLAAELGANLRDRPVRLGADSFQHEATLGLVAAGRSRPMWAEAAVRGSLSAQGHGLELMLGVRLQAGPIELFVLSSRGIGPASGTPDLRAIVGMAWSSAMSSPLELSPEPVTEVSAPAPQPAP